MKKKTFYIFVFFILFTSLVFSAPNNADYSLNVDSLTVSETTGTALVNIRVTPKNKKTHNKDDKIIIHYQTQNATSGSLATANSDYVAITNNTLQITPDNNGKATVYIPVTIINDNVQKENDENFILKIISASINSSKSIYIGKGGLITIKDDDTSGLPELSVNDIIVNESEGIATFTVSLNGTPTNQPVTFKYATQDGTAIEGDDYVPEGQTATIPAGNTSINITISLINDLISEKGDETFEIILSDLSSNALMADNKGVAKIIDDDTDLTMSINDATVGETNNNKDLIVKLIFSEPLKDDLTVVYHTEENTAKNSVDFTKIISNTITVPAGSLEHNITLEIVGDKIEEGTEDFYLQIDSISGNNKPVLADSISKITIFDNDGSEGCSPFQGMMTINEYQNNPHYFDSNHQKVKGNYVEIKYIDFLVKRFIKDSWSVTVYSNAGRQSISWDKRDLACVDPRYEVFQFDNKVMGAVGYVVLADENGNEIDVLDISNSDHYTPKCDSFPYDTDFESSAQNKDLFRDPDGTGNWYDTGKGANSEGSRCITRDGLNGLLFTEFDAIDTDEVTPDIILNENSVPIKTKEQNDNFGLKVLSMDVTTGKLKNTTVEVKVFLADENGNKLVNNNPGVLVNFLNSNVSFNSNFFYPEAMKKVRLYFEYCINDNGDAGDWSNCYGTANVVDRQMRSHSRDMFALRPHKLNFVNNTNSDFYHLLKAGEDYNLGIEAVDNSGNRAYGYTTSDNYMNYLVPSETRYFKDDSEDLTNDLKGTLNLNKSADAYMINGYSSADVIADINPEEVIGFSYTDVGKIKLDIYDDTWAIVDADDTPADCTSTSHMYICGDTNLTFIPDHFVIEDFNITNNDGEPDTFTYLANDLENMSVKIEAKIKAVNKNEDVVENFKEGALYYENEVNITPEIIIDDENTAAGYFYPIANVTGVSNQKVGFGKSGVDNPGERIFKYDETLFPINFNFKRDNNRESNPVTVKGSQISLQIDSNYTDGTKNSIILGKVAGNDTDHTKCVSSDNCVMSDADNNVTMYYGIAKPSKYFYNNVVENFVDTPILANVYCDLGYVQCQLYGIDVINGNTNEANWWISTKHKESNGYGKIVLEEYNVTEGTGNPTIDNEVVQIETNGYKDDVRVNANATKLPLTTSIRFVTDSSLADYTNEWLIYNTESATDAPEQFYKVRFITPASGWSGIGTTGNVLNTDATRQTNKRSTW